MTNTTPRRKQSPGTKVLVAVRGIDLDDTGVVVGHFTSFGDDYTLVRFAGDIKVGYPSRNVRAVSP